jgi:hypothetical protein
MNGPLKHLGWAVLYFVLVIVFLRLFLLPFLKYLVAPLIVVFKFGKSLKIFPQSIDFFDLPPTAAADIKVTAPQLAALGFTALGYAKSEIVAGRAENYLHLWVHKDFGDTALVAVERIVRRYQRSGQTCGVTFSKRFSDDSGIATSNVERAGALPLKSRISGVVFTGLYDVATLYRVHRARSAQNLDARKPELPEDFNSYINRQSRKVAELRAASGYVRLNPKDQTFSMTFKGAFTGMWRRLWPLKQMITAERNRKADAMLKELGFGDLKTLLASQANSAELVGKGPPPLPQLGVTSENPVSPA